MSNPYERIAELEAALAEARAEVAVLTRDSVSGLQVRAVFEQRLEAVSQRRKGDQPFGIVMVDIDHFKRVNDEHGHRVGDEVLSRVAQTVASHTRSSDTVARYGGEEFVAIIARADESGLRVLCERIRGAIEALDERGLPQVTASFGYAIQQDDEEGQSVVERADAALYRAKAGGRNRVEGP